MRAKFKGGLLRLLPFVDQAVVSGTSFVTGLALARLLGLRDYGYYVLLYSGLLLAVTLQQAAIISPLMTHGPKVAPEDRRAYVQAYSLIQFGFGAVSAVLLALILLVAAALLPGWPTPETVLLLAAMTFLYQAQDFYRRSYYAYRQYGTLIVIDVAIGVAQVAAIITASLLGVLTLPVAMLAVAASYVIGTGWGAIRYGLGGNLGEVRRILAENWAMSRWLMPSAILQWAGQNLLLLISSSLLGTWAAGALRAAQNVVGVLNILFISVENTIPVQATLAFRDGGLPALRRNLIRVAAGGLLVVLAVLSPLILFPGTLMGLLYGADLVPLGGILRGMCLIYLLAFIGIPIRVALRTAGRSRAIFVSYLLSTIASVIVVYPLVTRFGIGGMIAALVVAQLVLHAYYAVQLWQLFRHPPPTAMPA